MYISVKISSRIAGMFNSRLFIVVGKHKINVNIAGIIIVFGLVIFG